MTANCLKCPYKDKYGREGCTENGGCPEDKEEQ
jgi:hypothetical protein